MSKKVVEVSAVAPALEIRLPDASFTLLAKSELTKTDPLLQKEVDITETVVYSVAASASEPALDEYETIIKEKPTSNIFVTPFTSTGLTFNYQPSLIDELNPKDYDVITETEAYRKEQRVVYRPENVVGSYAVYQTNPKLGTGKVFHIYRPEAIDAAGTRVWCTLKVDTDSNQLIITIPQTFLDKAVYPIVLDPTFGYIDIGGTTAHMWNGYYMGCKFSLTEAAEINSVSVYTKYSWGDTSYNTKTAIYDASTNSRQSISNNIATGSWGWCVGNQTVSLSAADYYLSFGAIDADLAYAYDAGAENQSKECISGAMLPATFGEVINYYTRKISIYASYTAASTYSPKTRSSVPNLMVQMLNSKMLFG